MNGQAVAFEKDRRPLASAEICEPLGTFITVVLDVVHNEPLLGLDKFAERLWTEISSATR